MPGAAGQSKAAHREDRGAAAQRLLNAKFSWRIAAAR